ncbi:hypothetical protein BDV23DRAFT_181505 [Aspergillus alliaceus]|uniref:Uncharacterized protein n=1 Tax=Petromyces alliaceus TaxID=209559 RepID=A0A5N7CEI8_PETAA|nr:hypothetical protein BDV23DRAFT_181505 [Aspergillus alliaceus]
MDPHPHERGEVLGSSSGTGGNGERRALQQQRRMRKIQARRRQLQQPSVDQEPMELERISTGDSDEDMSDQGLLTWERSEGSAAAPQTEPIPPSSTLVHLESREHSIAVSVSEDGEHTTPSPGRRNSSIGH